MANPTVYPAGFLPYGSDDDSIILEEPLTSDAGVFTANGAGAGSIDYNSNGVLLNATAGLSYALSTEQKNALALGGTVSCEVERDFITTSYTGGSVSAAHEYVLGFWTPANVYGAWKANASTQIRLRNSTAGVIGAVSDVSNVSEIWVSRSMTVVVLSNKSFFQFSLRKIKSSLLCNHIFTKLLAFMYTLSIFTCGNF